MDRRDFVIGESFWTYAGEYRCTDIGSRVVVAIKLGPTDVVMVEDSGDTSTHVEDDPGWFSGPPYAVPEVVFDEDDLEVCFPTREAMLAGQDEDPPREEIR